MRSIETSSAAAGRAARLTVGLGLCALSACNTPMSTESTRGAGAPAQSAGPAFVLPATSSDEYKLRIARRLVVANPAITYLTPAENPLFAIPVLEVEVDADGNVRNITVVRRPSDDDAQDTIQIAIDAVRRAAPFGDARHVPRPWKFTQVFLFDETRRFKPQLLD